MGHATRSRVVIEHLVGQGHDVRVVASGRASAYLAERVPHVGEIWGLTMAYSDNEVRRWETVVRNLQGAVSGWPQNVREYFRIAEAFAPDAVVSDFESFAWLFGRRHGLPVISVDNIQILDRCRHDDGITAGQQADFEIARALVRWKLPGCAHYLITTFFEPPVRRRRTTLVPSLLRPEILAAVAEPGDHLLVYQTAEGNEDLPEALASTGLECRVYGFRRDLDADVRDGRIVYRPFAEEAFIDDLRTAHGVVSGGGYTLLSECVHLGVPALSVPLRGPVRAGAERALPRAPGLRRLRAARDARRHRRVRRGPAGAPRGPGRRAAARQRARPRGRRRPARGGGRVNDAVRVGVLCALALWFALIEIEIEGRHGWALRLPTWFRTRGPAGRLYGAISGGKPLTGYHLFMASLPLVILQLPFGYGEDWSIAAEVMVLATYMAFAIGWDYLWFILNPAYGLARFRRGRGVVVLGALDRAPARRVLRGDRALVRRGGDRLGGRPGPARHGRAGLARGRARAALPGRHGGRPGLPALVPLDAAAGGRRARGDRLGGRRPGAVRGSRRGEARRRPPLDGSGDHGRGRRARPARRRPVRRVGRPLGLRGHGRRRPARGRGADGRGADRRY